MGRCCETKSTICTTDLVLASKQTACFDHVELHRAELCDNVTALITDVTNMWYRSSRTGLYSRPFGPWSPFFKMIFLAKTHVALITTGLSDRMTADYHFVGRKANKATLIWSLTNISLAKENGGALHDKKKKTEKTQRRLFHVGKTRFCHIRCSCEKWLISSQF